MSLVRRDVLGLLPAVLLAPRPAVAAASLADVVRRQVDARGGAARLDGIRTFESAVRVTEPGFEAIGRYLAAVDGGVRVDVYVGGKRVFSEGADAEGAWSLGEAVGEPKPASEAGRQALLHGVEYNLVGLHRYAERGTRLTLAGRETFAGADCDVVQANFADGFETRFYIDRTSAMIVGRRDRRAYHPDVDATAKRVETRFGDFRAVEGIRRPFLVEDYDMASGGRIGRTETVWVRHNPQVEGRISRRATPPPGPPTTAEA